MASNLCNLSTLNHIGKGGGFILLGKHGRSKKAINIRMLIGLPPFYNLICDSIKYSKGFQRRESIGIRKCSLSREYLSDSEMTPWLDWPRYTLQFITLAPSTRHHNERSN